MDEQEIEITAENNEQEIEVINDSLGFIPSGTLEITENGGYNVNNYANANVNVPQPSGSINITENGEYNVTDYATANVQTSGITPTGELSITQNGTYDVTQYASANVNLAVSKYAPKFVSFRDCTETNLLNETSGLDTTNITTMENMFRNCKNLTTIDLSGWNTVNVTNMSYMFNGANALTSLDLSSFKTLNVTNMSFMLNFSGTPQGDVETITFSNNWNTSKVTNMSSMFRAPKLKNIDISMFDLSSVTNMDSMFTSQCALLTNASLQSIAQALITATNENLTTSKTLRSIGLSSSQANKIKNFEEWTTLTANGWTTGY